MDIFDSTQDSRKQFMVCISQLAGTIHMVGAQLATVYIRCWYIFIRTVLSDSEMVTQDSLFWFSVEDYLFGDSLH